MGKTAYADVFGSGPPSRLYGGVLNIDMSIIQELRLSRFGPTLLDPLEDSVSFVVQAWSKRSFHPNPDFDS